METQDATLIGVIFFLAQVITKILERLLDRVLEKKSEQPPSASEDFEKDLQRLLDWHDVKDQDGVFVWYFPKRAVNDRFDEIVRTLQDIRDRQQELTSDIIDELRKK